MDGQSVSGKYVEWTEAKLHEPAGTYGMKASEVNNIKYRFLHLKYICPYIRSYILLEKMGSLVEVENQTFGLDVWQ